MAQTQGQYAPSGASFYNSSAAEETAQIKTTAGLMMMAIITNSSGSTRYAYLFDSESASSGTPIVPPVPLATNTQVVVALPYAVPFSNGLKIAASSTNATFTASAASDFRMTVLYK